MRFIVYLLLLALIGYGLWPFYTVFRLDQAINENGTAALAPLVDLDAVREQNRARISAGVESLMPPRAGAGGSGGPGGPASPGAPGRSAGPGAMLGQTLERFGAAALEAGVEQYITLDWVRETLRDAVTRATRQSPPYLIGAIDYAFLERHDQLLVRIGRLGYGETHLRLTRQGSEWKLTDIIR